MFDSIIIRKSLPGSADIDIGLMAECLLFYEKIHLIADMSMLRKIVEHIGLDVLEELINQKHIILSFSPFITGTRVNAEYTPHEVFDYCSIIRVPGKSMKTPDFEALFFEMLEKGSGKKGKSRRVGTRLFGKTDIIELDKIVPVEKGIPEISRRDLDNPEFLSSALKIAIQHLAPHYPLPSNWKFQVFRYRNGFKVITNIDFEELNKWKSKEHFPDAKSKLSRSYLLDTILKANEDLFLSAYFQSEIVTKALTSSIIELKVSEVVKKTKKNAEKLKLFQDVVLSEAKSIREVINEGKKEFKEILPLIEKSYKFKHWLQEKGDNANLMKEYYQSVSEKTWVQKLPSKILRFSIFTGAGIIADAFITGGIGSLVGVALGFGDNFLIDSLAKGWKPDQYIDEIKGFLK
jgi:hypothetical protein